MRFTETFSSWAAGICAAAVISAAVTALIPSGNLEKSVKTVVSVFLICSLVMPFVKGNVAINGDISKNIEEYEETENALLDEAQRQTEEFMKNSVVEILSENGIICEDVIIQSDMKDGELSIVSVTVVSPSADAQTVKNIVKSQLGAEVTVE